MATSNSKQTQVLLATFITFFLLLLNKVNSSDELSFRFDKFVPNPEDLLFQGDATVSSTGVLQVTKVENGKPKPYSVGRARHIAPLHLWDSTTGRVSSFYTSFTFVVKAPDASITSDGLAFFLAPPDSQIPSGMISRYIGLFNNSNYDSSNQIVAVEFDTYFAKDYDPWDPNFRHIGIDVNSINSTKTAKWDWRNGEVANVEVIYEAHITKLTVHLFYDSPLTDLVRLEATVDLKAILPEWVRVGFCAATGASGALGSHDVLSWVFISVSGSNNFAELKNNMHIARYTA